MTPDANSNRGTNPSALELIPVRYRIFFGIASLAEGGLGAFIIKSSGFVQILALILFSIIMLVTIFCVYKLLSKEISLSYIKEKAKTKKAGHGIVKYWATRDRAFEEIKDGILNAEKEIFISGIVLSTFLSSIKHINFINDLAIRFVENSELKLTIVVLAKKPKGPYRMIKKYEKKIGNLDTLSKACLNLLKDFKKGISDKLEVESKCMKRIEFRHYTGVIPHHFIVKLDNKMYVSSYFSHGMGSVACLLKLEDIEKRRCLYRRFLKEIVYIKNQSQEFKP